MSERGLRKTRVGFVVSDKMDRSVVVEVRRTVQHKLYKKFLRKRKRFHLRILTAACEAWDRCCQAREVIDREGLIYTDRFGSPRARPEISIERDCRLAFMRAVRELDLDTEPPTQPRRPRALASNKG